MANKSNVLFGKCRQFAFGTVLADENY